MEGLLQERARQNLIGSIGGQAVPSELVAKARPRTCSKVSPSQAVMRAQVSSKPLPIVSACLVGYWRASSGAPNWPP